LPARPPAHAAAAQRGRRFDAAGAAITVWSGGERAERIGAGYVAWHTPSDGQETIRRVEWSASRRVSVS